MAGVRSCPGSVMDPTSLTLADVYAGALLDAADAAGQAAPLAAELEEFVGLLGRVEGFSELLSGHGRSRDERMELIRRLVAGRVSRLLEALLMTLARRDRLYLTGVVADRFARLWDARRNRVEVAVTSAVALSETQRQRIVARLADAIGAEPLLTERVDAALVGGMKVQIGDRVYDASIAGELELVKKRFRQGQSAGVKG